MRVVERTDLIMPVAESKESRMMSATIVILKDNDIPQHPHGQQYPSTSSWSTISLNSKKKWMEKITDLVSGIPLELLHLWEVNHEINLIDPDKHIWYQLPKCLEHFHEELFTKLERYTIVQWWIPTVAHQVVPMLCIPKKNGMLPVRGPQTPFHTKLNTLTCSQSPHLESLLLIHPHLLTSLTNTLHLSPL